MRSNLFTFGDEKFEIPGFRVAHQFLVSPLIRSAIWLTDVFRFSFVDQLLHGLPSDIECPRQFNIDDGLQHDLSNVLALTKR
jgi:hypothetical protein